MKRSATSQGGRALASAPVRWALALLIVGLISVGLLACGSSSDGGETTAASQATWVPGLEGVKSGEIEAQLILHGPAIGGRIFSRLLGQFLEGGEGKLPQMEIVAEAVGRKGNNKIVSVTALTARRHDGAVAYGWKVYKIDPKTFESIVPGFEQALGDGTAADPYACLEAATKIDLARIAGRTIARDPHATSNDGAKVTAVTTMMKPSTLNAILDQLMEDPGCGAQLRVARPLRQQLEFIARDFAETMKKAELETFVDENGLLRELKINATLAWEGKELNAALTYSVSRINEITELLRPTTTTPIEALSRRLGFNPLRAIEAGAPGLGGLLEGIYGRASA